MTPATRTSNNIHDTKKDTLHITADRKETANELSSQSEYHDAHASTLYLQSPISDGIVSQEDQASTDAGDDTQWQHSSSSSDGTHTDSEAGDDASCDGNNMASCFVYSITLLLQLRGMVARNAKAEPPAVCYSTRPCKDQVQPSENKASVSGKKISQKSGRASLPAPSATSFVAYQQAVHASTQDDNDRVTRSVRSILNKLTVEKFDALFEQLTECGLRTVEHVIILVREIFEKATTQHNFIPMYADFCVSLECDRRIAVAMEANKQHQSFRRLLLNQCQVAFEKLLGPHSHPDNEQAEDARILVKRRAIGNVKFVGELLIRGMLSSRLLCSCAEELLNEKEAVPEALESLAALLTVAAPKFDVKTWQLYSRLNDVFQHMQELSINKTLPSRIRFLLRDVLELRSAGWEKKSQSAAQKQIGGEHSRQVPKKIEEKAQEDACTSPTAQQKGDHQDMSRGGLSQSTSHQSTSTTTSVDMQIKQDVRAVSEAPTASSKMSSTSGASRRRRKRVSRELVEGLEAGEALDHTETSRCTNSGVTSTQQEVKSKPNPHTSCTPSHGASPTMKEPAYSKFGSHDDAKLVTRPCYPREATQNPNAAASYSKEQRYIGNPSISASCVNPVNTPPPQTVPKAQTSPHPHAGGSSGIESHPFDAVAFHKELSTILRDLGSNYNVAAAVGRVRAQNVPVRLQGQEFTDILTRAVEERRGPARRSAFAFAAGLAAAEQSAFDRSACFQGIKMFFEEVYAELCTEVPRLPAIVTAELLPTLRSVLPTAQLNTALPAEMQQR